MLGLWDENKMNSKVKVQDEVNLHNLEKRAISASWMENGATDLMGTTSSTSFTRPTTFRRRNQSPPYSILYASPQGLHPNVTFFRDSQVKSQNWDSCCPKTLEAHIFLKSSFSKMKGQHLIPYENIFLKCIACSNRTSFAH
jgi:hypothetical protein